MKQLLVYTCVFTLLLGCAPKEEELPSTNVELEGGLWSTDCFADMSVSIKMTSYFSGGEFKQSLTVFSDTTCQSKSLYVEVTGTYAATLKPESSTTYYLDLKAGQTSATAYTQDMVDGITSDSNCGSGWQVGVKKDITGVSCDSFETPALDEMQYDIYSIAEFDMPSFGQASGDLLFGSMNSTEDGTTPEKRPTSLGEPVYRRN